MLQTLSRTPLYEVHRSLGGKMVPFAGWEMPVQYTSIMKEHQAVRESCGVFDISHMGEVFISGPDAAEALNGLLTNDVLKLDIGQGQYTLMLNEAGGVIDDLILYRISNDSFFAVINAACIDGDVRWMMSHFQGKDLRFFDASADWVALAVQGPEAGAVFAKVFPEWQLPPRNGIARRDDLIVCRTGYTGEDGFEFFCPLPKGRQWFEAFLAAGAQPCGLGCRDSLRLEMGFPLNGSDLSPQRTPLEAGLGWFVKMEKGDFVGRDVLLQQQKTGLKNSLLALQYEQVGPPPRAGYAVVSSEGDGLGELTSGVFSPSLKTGIGMAYLPAQMNAIGTDLFIEVRGKQVAAKVVKKPFYKV